MAEAPKVAVHSAAVEEEKKVPVDQAEPEADHLTTEQYMRIIIEQESKLDELRRDNQSAAEKLEQIHAAATKREEEEHGREVKKAQLITETLTAEWKKELPDTLLTDEVVQSLKLVAEKMPRHATAIYELSHMASAQHKKLSEEFTAFKTDLTRAQSESEFRAVMQRRRNVTAVTAVPVAHEAPVTHEASARKEPSREQVFRQLAAKYRPGNALSTMDTLVQGRRKRPRLPFA
jgi:hypothetical protein